MRRFYRQSRGRLKSAFWKSEPDPKPGPWLTEIEIK
jgi:hypothetical protein